MGGVLDVGGARIAIGPAGDDRRAASRAMLVALLPDECALSQVCPACGGAHGPVRVALRDGSPGPLVSVSYAGGLAAVGVAPAGATAFGIDLELDDEATRHAVREALGSRGTPAAVRLPDGPGFRPDVAAWTRLEAIAKARGAGLGRGAETGASGPVPRCRTARTDAGASSPVMLSVALG